MMTTETMMKKTITRYLGTCQICEQEQKLHGGKLVHHGYLRPGHGSIVGDCFGVYAPPYEVSCAQIGIYLAMVRNELVVNETRLLALEAGEVKTLSRSSGSRAIYRETKTFVFGEVPNHVWSIELRRAIEERKSRIYYIKKDITRLETRIDAWKPAPIRTIEEREAEEKVIKDARAAERTAARQIKANAVAATKAKQAALQAKREAIMLDFKNRFITLAEGPDSPARKELAQGIARETSLKKYSFFYTRDLKCDEAFITLGLAYREGNNAWVRYYYPLT